MRIWWRRNLDASIVFMVYGVELLLEFWVFCHFGRLLNRLAYLSFFKRLTIQINRIRVPSSGAFIIKSGCKRSRILIDYFDVVVLLVICIEEVWLCYFIASLTIFYSRLILTFWEQFVMQILRIQFL